MSNYLKYYTTRKDGKATHAAEFIHARRNYPRHLGHSKDYYYVRFLKLRKIGPQDLEDWFDDVTSKEYTIEDFEKFIKENKFREVD